MPCGYIYKIQFPNGKHYIGLTTTSLENRKKQHRYAAKKCGTKYLYNALRKYKMEDTFELIQIDTADTVE
jgi:predicted GIY-YIG superfamily endonuclease